jgi:hypothetical protein
MDIKTITAILPVAKQYMTEEQHTHFTHNLRVMYLMTEVAAREEYLARKIRQVELSNQFEQDLIKLKAQLAALS